MVIALNLLKLNLKFNYFFLKLLPTNNKKVVLISRQSNNISLDFRLLREEILKIDSNYKVVVLCDKIDKSFIGLIHYYFHTLKQLYHLATSKACIVNSYCPAVSIPKHKKSLTIIQIWHAIATVKKFGYQTLGKRYGRNEKIAKIMNMHKNYDWVISGSKVMVPIFSETFNTDISKIKPIGTPRIDYLLNNNEDVKNTIINKYPDIKNKKVILYAPTFRRKENVKLDKLLNTIDFEKYNLIVKFHPVKGQKIENSNIYTCPGVSTLQLLTVADYVITDYSAISIEASLLNKPVYFYIYDIEDYEENNGLNIDLCNEMKEMCYKDFNELYKNLESGKYNYQKLKKFKNKYVSNQNGNSGYILANYVVNGAWLDSKNCVEKKEEDKNEQESLYCNVCRCDS